MINKFLVLSIIAVLLSYLTVTLLPFNELLYQSYTEKFATDQIQKIFELQEKWQWVSYAIIPLILLIKTTLITSVLYIGAFFYSKVKVTFKQLWHIAVKAEYLFLLVGVAKIIWFYFFKTTYTLEDLQYFYPLSALNIVGYKGLETWFVYPLQVLNLFELVYWLILAYYIGKIASPTKNGIISKYPIDFGLKIVASSYGSALLLWVVVVMFFTLNYS